MKNVLISPDYKVHVPITDQISSEKVINYISKNRTLIKVNVENTKQSIAKSLTLIGEQSITHGFIENNMNIKVDEKIGEISLFLKENPLLVPFNFFYETTDSCEIALTESNIENMIDFLPLFQSIVIQIPFGKENEKPMNLNVERVELSINVDFASGWKEHPLQQTTNEIVLNLTASSLTFTNKGFLVQIPA